MLKQRVKTAVVALPPIMVLVWLGIPWFSIFIAGVVLLGAFEFFHITAWLDRKSPLTYLGLLWALALAMSPHYGNARILPAVMTAGVVISLAWLLLHSPREGAFHKWAWVAAGVLYVGWMLSYWLDLRIMEDGRSWVYLAMCTTFANDSGAFFAGRAWGRRQLAPDISPGKTWAGGVGGLLASIAGAMLVSWILGFFFPGFLACWQLILLACLISLFAQVGDLVESLLKRNVGLKQSSSFLPGHGGILDRFDSFIFVGAMVYYYALWVAA